jgi:hypothetical protein
MDWFEIFKTGTHTDAAGNTSEWTEEDLDKIVSSYDPVNHEAPIVIGHPEVDSPAYGWIEALKRVGDRLLAKPRQLVDEFKTWIREGRYKKVSISLYPDLTLKHVGFLGATPPAVKGLASIGFQEKGEIVIFSDWKEVMEMTNVKDPGKEIEQRIKEVLKNPRSHVNKYGVRFSEDITYSQALTYVCEEDPDLARAYAEILRPSKRSEREKKCLAAGEKIVTLVNQKMKAKGSLSYSEALTEVQKENRELILEYLGK